MVFLRLPWVSAIVHRTPGRGWEWIRTGWVLAGNPRCPSESKSKRDGCPAGITDPFVRRRVETHLTLLEPLDTAIRRLEKESTDAAGDCCATELAVLQSNPGVGKVLSLTIFLEIERLDRFETRQQFCSDTRLCGAVQTSDNKRCGAANKKAGNARL